VEQVKTAALAHDIWEQINLELDAQYIEDLEKPTRISPLTIKAKRPKICQTQTQKFVGNDDEDNDNDELLASPTIRTNPKDDRMNEYEVGVEVSDDSPLTTDERETLRYEMSRYEEEN
jgi:hypothetical protein